MRTLDGRLLADLNDNVPANITGSVGIVATSSLNENETTYGLLPERINAVPYIVNSIYDTSTPQIKPIQFNDPDKYNLFIDAQGIVKVAVGSTFTLKMEAKQPPIYNVENGVPTLYSDETNLTYEWEKDGEVIYGDVDQSRPDSYIQARGDKFQELHFNNISPNFAGSYNCVVSNDIGSTESELITIEVYNPDIEDAFYTNLVQNPYGKNGTDGWNSPDLEFIASRFSDASFRSFSQPWNVDLFGYNKDMLYPRPYHLNTYHIKNSSLAQDLLQEGHYFTRERFKYRAKDGKSIINANYDVDVSNIVDYIQGSVYGVEGVRAVFGCYIGNAISKFRVTVLNALVTRRSSKYSLLPSKPRLDILNALLAGLPHLMENIRVIIQEFDEETPLMSLKDGVLVPGIELTDPWTKAVNGSPGTIISGTFATSTEAKILEVAQNNKLFPSQEYIPTYGQYAEFNRFVIDKLNFRTNKIRISIRFEAWHDVLGLLDKVQLEQTDECFEHVPWEWIALPMRYPMSDSDYLKAADSNAIMVDWYNQKNLNIPKDEPFRYATLLGPPRAMATGFNVVLIPLEINYPTKSDYYTRTILSTDEIIYPKVESGTSVAGEVGLYLGSLTDYDYEVIGVNIENRYNLPFTQGTVDASKARGEVASRTTVSTYLYNKEHTLEFPEVYNFTSSLWKPYTLTSNLDFRLLPTLGGILPQLQNREYVVVYNSGSGDLTEAGIQQVAGNIQSTIIKYINVINDVPATFATQSVTRNDYLKQIGFELNLVGEDYGIPTTESVAIRDPFKRENLKDWTTLYATSSYNYYYRLLEKIDEPTANTTTFVPAVGPQHIIYSDKFFSNWGESGQTDYRSSEDRISLANVFSFTSLSYYEQNQDIVGRFNFDNAASVSAAQTRARQNATAGVNISKEFYWNVKVNGQSVTMKRLVNQFQGVETVTVTYPGSNGPTISQEEYATYTYRHVGRTNDRVKLRSVQRNGMATPAAIVIPTRRKIYYFVYNYVDNVLGEK